MKNILSQKCFLITSFFAIALLVKVVFAAPPGSPYQPGETLDPTCVPGDTNCTVSQLSSQEIVTVQTSDSTPTVLTSVPVSDGKVVRINADVIVAESDESDRHFLNRSGLFYRNVGSSVAEKGTTGFGQIITSGLIFFGDASSQYDLTKINAESIRLTWDGTGTDPNFLSNGLSVGATIELNSPFFNEDAVNGTYTVINVTDDYFEVDNPEVTANQNDISETSIQASIPGPSIGLSANEGNQTVDVVVTGLPGSILNWNGKIDVFEVSSQ